MRKISKRINEEKEIIDQMRQKVKKDPVIVKKFKEYNVPLKEIDMVHIEFANLDVSAKTKNKKIYLNRAMLKPDSKVKDPSAYLVHELIHFLQQSTGNTAGHKAVDKYLDKPTEEEAFKSQIDYKKREESPEEAIKYVDDLLSYHKLKGKEKKEKKKELLDDPI